MDRPVILVNSNIVRPPVNPLGLEYVGEHLEQSGVPVEVLDLAWENDWQAGLSGLLSRRAPLAIGITFRNIDDCSSATRTAFLPWLKTLVQNVKQNTSAPVVLGGVGFSIAPGFILELSGADFGIAGDGEEAFLRLVQRIEAGRDPSDLANLVYLKQGRAVENPREFFDLARAPAPSRVLIDNRRYQQEGAQVGIETKRGCAEPCAYCADPLAKGRTIRARPPAAVAQEMLNLVEQGVNWYHLCDSEFNLPIAHAKEVCRAMIDAGLSEKARWYTYCAPIPFDDELARLMVKAGCCGINFGVDSLCDQQLERLGRRHRLGDLEKLVGCLREAGINFVFDLILGGPGETEDTLDATYREAVRLDLPLAGVAEGVRVYPYTSLARALGRDSAVAERGLLEPTFYFSPQLGSDPRGAVRRALRDDPRFLVLAAAGEARNYNYVGDTWLSDRIVEGARGAYWNIIKTRINNK